MIELSDILRFVSSDALLVWVCPVCGETCEHPVAGNTFPCPACGFQFIITPEPLFDPNRLLVPRVEVW